MSYKPRGKDSNAAPTGQEEPSSDLQQMSIFVTFLIALTGEMREPSLRSRIKDTVDVVGLLELLEHWSQPTS